MIEQDNDFELVQKYLDGDEVSFNLIAKKYHDRIYWHARRMTGNHLDADEIVQEVLIVLYNKLKTFEFKSSLYTWIYTITNSRSINFLNRKKIKRFFSFDDVSSELNYSKDILEDINDKQLLEKVEKSLQKLPVKQREVFILRNFNEMSYEEIAQVTGKSIGALKANHFHALNKLKELLNDKR